MTRLTSILSAAFFGLAFTFNAQANDCPAMSGEFTIGADGDFTSISDAVSSLKCGGVSGPVTFLVEDGTYDEIININNIQGLSGFNSVSFESRSGNNSEVVINFSSGESTMMLSSVSNISFENMTFNHKSANYGNVVKMEGKCSNIRFKGVVFNGVEASRTGSNSAVIYSTANGQKSGIAFEDCEINNGSFGLFKGGMSSDMLDGRTTITGTLFYGQFESGLALSNEQSPIITNNVFATLSNYQGYKSISLESCPGELIVSNNIVNAANGTYGLALNNCSGSATSYGQINNNSIAVGGNGELYGVYLTGNTDNQILNYNRIKLTLNSEVASNQAFYRNASSGQNVNLMNNMFYDLNTGGYTILGNTYKDYFNQLPAQGNASLSVSANGIMIEKVVPVR